MSMTRTTALQLILLLFLSCAFATAQTASSTADELYQAQKWDDAAKAYETIAKADPENGRAWFRLAVSLHKLGRFDSAVKAYERALEKMPAQAKPLAMYNLATSYAKLNDRDNSFKWLNDAFEGGFPQADLLRTDPDLQNIRDDKSRFSELSEKANRLTKPCLYQPEHKQFDFWVGEWNVSDAQGRPVGSSRIERIENGCIILENWDNGHGGTGKSINFYDATLHGWRQTWVSNSGGISEFAGAYVSKDNAIRFEGESHAPDGTTIRRKLTFFNLGPNKIRQYSEASTDGKTWSLDYDFIYTRKN